MKPTNLTSNLKTNLRTKSKKWSAPKYRASYKKKYGSKCFIEPNKLKYPICTNGKINCRALDAAQYYSILNNKHALTRKIKGLKNKLCHSNPIN